MYMWRTSACDASIFLGAFWVNNLGVSDSQACSDNVFLPWVTWLGKTFNSLLNFLPKTWELATEVCLEVSLLHAWKVSWYEEPHPIQWWVPLLSLQCWWQNKVCHLTVSNRAELPALYTRCWTAATCSWISSIPTKRIKRQHKSPHAPAHCFLTGTESRRSTLTTWDEVPSTVQEKLEEKRWQKLSTRKAGHTVWRSSLKSSWGHVLPSKSRDERLRQTKGPVYKHLTSPNTWQPNHPPSSRSRSSSKRQAWKICGLWYVWRRLRSGQLQNSPEKLYNHQLASPCSFVSQGQV